MMPHLERFAADPTEANFAKAQDAYKQACQTWYIWGRACNELLSAANISIEDVAFSNALPWRTKSEARFSRAVERATAENYVKPLLLDLQPRILVAVGKKVQRMIADAGMAPSVTWNRARALTQPVRAEREHACRLFRELVSI
jgi:uracil-DNA glycosylase